MTQPSDSPIAPAAKSLSPKAIYAQELLRLLSPEARVKVIAAAKKVAAKIAPSNDHITAEKDHDD